MSHLFPRRAGAQRSRERRAPARRAANPIADTDPLKHQPAIKVGVLDFRLAFKFQKEPSYFCQPLTGIRWGGVGTGCGIVTRSGGDGSWDLLNYHTAVKPFYHDGIRASLRRFYSEFLVHKRWNYFNNITIKSDFSDYLIRVLVWWKSLIDLHTFWACWRIRMTRVESGVWSGAT